MQLKVDGISVGYKDKTVLTSISLDFDRNGVYSIIGPNGVGKSTFLHCLNRLISPSCGHIMVDEKELSEYHLRELARKMGYVPYSASGNFPLSVLDAVIVQPAVHPDCGLAVVLCDLADASGTEK